MQQTTPEYLAEITAAQGTAVFPVRKARLNSKHWIKLPQAPEVEEVYKNLGGTGNCLEIGFSLPEGIETEKVRLSLDGSLHFNRYRAITLQSSVYEVHGISWRDAFRRNCRSQERECLKDGVRQGIWTNREAEIHFGKAPEAGDFSGPGASGWKLNAFREFLADVYLFNQPPQHKRISLYERLMIQGKLLPLQQLLLSRAETSQHYLVKYLSRQLEIPLKENKI